MKLMFASLVVVGCMLMGPLASADSLVGTQVTLTGDYPRLGTPFTNSVTATVGPGVEFPSGSLVTIVGGIEVIGVSIDVGASTIDLSYTASDQALSGAFNGYVFDFSGVTITGASLDPSSSYTSSQFIVGFSPTEVTVNAEGVFLTAGSNVVIDITAVDNSTSSATPEPPTYALALAGLAALGYFGIYRRPQTSSHA